MQMSAVAIVNDVQMRVYHKCDTRGVVTNSDKWI